MPWLKMILIWLLLVPVWRQTKLNIRRISMFEKRLPKSMYLKPQKTKLEFPNGSVIEAFPNNADTIRGLHAGSCLVG